MSIIRARQPIMTRLFPHQANKRFIIPNRRPFFDVDDFAWTIGDDGGTTIGYASSFAAGGPYGNLVPDNVEDLLIQRLIVTTTGDYAEIRLGETGDVQPPGISTITLDVEGYGETSPLTPRPGGEYRQSGGDDSAFVTYIAGLIGSTLAVDIQGA